MWNLDGLYLAVLRQNVGEDDADTMDYFKLIMGRILAAIEPLSVSALDELCSPDEPEDPVHILKYLGALLSGADEKEVPVHPLHTSFCEFLLDPIRSQDFHVDLSLGHKHLAFACLQAMKCGLSFNISQLDNSHLCNDKVPKLVTNIRDTIPIHLAYSCCNWTVHLQNTAFNVGLLQQVQYFMHFQFLYWLEVLSLCKEFSIASSAMIIAADWIQVSGCISIVPVHNTNNKFRIMIQNLLHLPQMLTDLALPLNPPFHKVLLTFTYLHCLLHPLSQRCRNNFCSSFLIPLLSSMENPHTGQL
jgi:hypothetical protein